MTAQIMFLSAQKFKDKNIEVFCTAGSDNQSIESQCSSHTFAFLYSSGFSATSKLFTKKVYETKVISGFSYLKVKHRNKKSSSETADKGM